MTECNRTSNQLVGDTYPPRQSAEAAKRGTQPSPTAVPAFDGDQFLNEIRTELERIARAQERLCRDVEKVTARLAGTWPTVDLPNSIKEALNSGDGSYRP